MPERSYIYGHRHQPNSTYEIRKNCLHCFFEFNSLGFRDAEPSLSDTSFKVAVIGDSFMEGIGVKEEERVSDLLEQKTGIPHLNFAMADKGSTQAFVIYDKIVSNYPHDAVLLALFPINDMIDDDPSVGKNENSIRPCWKGNYPDYELVFFPDTAPAQKDYSAWKHFLKTHTYTYDALFYLKESMKEKMGSRKSYPQTGYYSYTHEQLNRIKYSLLQIKEKAGEKPLIVISIPSHRGFDKTRENKMSSIEVPLREFCKTNNIEFIGLFETLNEASPNPDKEFYYSCDSHWNAKGHQLATEVILQQSEFYRNLIEK